MKKKQQVHIEHRLDRFLDEEIEDIKEIGDALVLEEGKIKDDKVDHSIRNTRIAWIHPNTETHWLFSRAILVFKSSLPFFSTLQSMQYTVYHGEDNSHYTWHRDIGTGDKIMKARVTVGIVQLSHPSEYKGGVLQIKHEDEVIDVMKTKGMVTTFPIQLLHRVTPVTSGVRKTLIMWGLK
jgi:PKHD-type hydroxylase